MHDIWRLAGFMILLAIVDAVLFTMLFVFDLGKPSPQEIVRSGEFFGMIVLIAKLAIEVPAMVGIFTLVPKGSARLTIALRFATARVLLVFVCGALFHMIRLSPGGPRADHIVWYLMLSAVYAPFLLMPFAPRRHAPQDD